MITFLNTLSYKRLSGKKWHFEATAFQCSVLAPLIGTSPQSTSTYIYLFNKTVYDPRVIWQNEFTTKSWVGHNINLEFRPICHHGIKRRTSLLSMLGNSIITLPLSYQSTHRKVITMLDKVIATGSDSAQVRTTLLRYNYHPVNCQPRGFYSYQNPINERRNNENFETHY